MLKKSFAIILLLFTSNIVICQNQNIFGINKALGRGMNMGNMFEAPSEGEWGNPYKDDYFQKISALGFNHVRIPIRWDVPARALQTDPYTINPIFFARIKTVIDNAIANKLYVVFNMHHHEGLFANPAMDKAKFLAQWAQIAEFFKDYDQHLLFEVMNEPHNNLTPALWNVYFNEALGVIRKTNPTRAVVMGVANYGGLSGLPELKIPDDKNLILTIHYYNPFNFTHQGAEWIGNEAQAWLGTKWEDLSVERSQVTSEFDPLIALSKQKNIPIHIGEFGAYGKADIDSRVKWTTYLARWFEQQGWSWAYWEWSAGFGIYDPTNAIVNTKLADALLKNPMPEAKKLATKVLYQSSFTTDNDGWAIGLQPGSDAALSRTNNNLNVDVKTSVKDGWHVQMTKNNLAITNKKRYQVTVKASASNPTSVTCYVAKASSPYNSYSGFTNFGFGANEKEYSFTFIMNDPTDPVARMSFDMGLSISKITISSIKLEEILDETAPPVVVVPPVVVPPVVIVPQILANELEISKAITISPNPVKDILTIGYDKSINYIEIFDTRGKILYAKSVRNNNSTAIDFKDFSAGIHFIYLYSEKYKFAKKIIKN
jgi:endoglucanase